MTRAAVLPVWRSMLYVPVNVDRFVDKAHTRGADAIQLDLEDSVPPAEKAAARRLVQGAAEKVARGGADVLVRINRPWREALEDLEASVSPRVQGLALPKIESADHVRMIAEVVGELERERGMVVGSTKLVAMIETASAFFRMEAIAAADPRVVGLTLGSEDFALSVGMLPEADGLLYPKVQVVIAARAAGILPLGFVGTVADYQDLDRFREIVRRSRRLGFQGAGCIHPGQVRVLNEEYRPSPEEVAHARRVTEAYEKAAAAGVGAFEVDGRMVDIPVVERARGLLARDQAIRERERRAAAAG